MGGPKTKTSRKGKKAWRKNIDTTQEQEVIAKQSHEERHGPAAESLADSQLFFVDTGADEKQAAAVVRGAKRKRAAEYKPLRSQLIINAAHLARAVPHPAKKHKVNNLSASKRGAQQQQLAEQQGAQQQPRQQLAAAADGTVDRAQAVIDARKAAGEHPLDLWGDEDLFASGQQEQQAAGKKRKVPGRGRGPPAQKVKAVAVDAAGCSFNPDKELHQDALAVLVAQEHKKEIKKEMMPKAPPATVPGASQPVDELEALLDVGGGANDDENEIDVEGEDGDSDAGEEDGKGDKQQKAARKKTKTDRNKEKKRRAADKEAEARRKLKAQRAQIDNVRKVQTDLEELQAEQRLRQQRREIAKAEKAAVLPPRLGKHKFEPPSVQVLTTDEINGSLRRLRACPMVTLDRFKSLQQRGLIEPRRPLAQAKQRRVVEYEKNARNEKAVASQQELRDLQQQNNQTRKKAAAAGKAH